MVFLVDDDIDDVEIVQEAFQRNHYTGEIGVASNGKVFMEQIHATREQDRPKIILLDLNMPLKNGFQVLDELKNDPSLKTIPVIVLTASNNKSDEIRCFELGCSLFYTKPTTVDDYNLLVTVVINFMKGKSPGSLN
jgi:CheY-like chemotaxis protein